MRGLIAVAGVYVRPVDADTVYVVREDETGTGYVCRRLTTAGVDELIGSGDTPRRAASLIPV